MYLYQHYMYSTDESLGTQVTEPDMVITMYLLLQFIYGHIR